MKKPNEIQNILDRCVAKFTSAEELLPLALSGAAKRRNVSISKPDIQRLATALLNADGDVIHLDFDPPCALGATKEAIQETVQVLLDAMQESISDVEQHITEAISQAVPEALAKTAELLGETISEHALEHTLHLRKVHGERAKMVHRMWGEALGLLDLLRHIVLEWGCAALDIRKGAYANPNTAFALDRIFIRAYEVAGEVIVLAGSGYSDGALARWRSLHEICVIAMFLSKQSDRCARMYLSHHKVEELRLLEMDVADRLAGPIRHSDRYLRQLRKQKSEMINAFGAAFSGDYGWASIELGRARITFRELESHVGLERLRRGYQRANSTVHGGALATLTRISLGAIGVHGTDIPPAYGCEVAIKYTAESLSMMIAELCLKTESADLIAMSMVVHNYATKIGEQIERTRKNASGDSPRGRILMRKAAQRKSRAKPRRTFRKF